MPRYVYRCSECRNEEEYTLPVAERDDPVGLPCALPSTSRADDEASYCDGALKRVYSPYNVLGAGVGDVI